MARVVLLTTRHYEPQALLDTVEREQVNVLVIVGDPFARPMLAALDAEPDRWDVSSLIGIISSGAMWSEEVKKGLLRHHPGLLLVDAFCSSEAIGDRRLRLHRRANPAHRANSASGPT